MPNTTEPIFTLFWEYQAGSIVVQATLEEIGARYQLQYVDMGAGEHLSEAYRRRNPAGRVPALQGPDGEAIGETGAIITLLSELYPEARCAPAPGDKDRAAFLFWLNVLTTSGYMTAGRVGHAELTGAAGLSHPSEFLPHHLIMRESDRDMVTGEEVYPYLPEGFLLHDEADKFGYLDRWKRSRANDFAPFDV